MNLFNATTCHMAFSALMAFMALTDKLLTGVNATNATGISMALTGNYYD